MRVCIVWDGFNSPLLLLDHAFALGSVTSCTKMYFLVPGCLGGRIIAALPLMADTTKVTISLSLSAALDRLCVEERAIPNGVDAAKGWLAEILLAYGIDHYNEIMDAHRAKVKARR